MAYLPGHSPPRTMVSFHRMGNWSCCNLGSDHHGQEAESLTSALLGSILHQLPRNPPRNPHLPLEPFVTENYLRRVGLLSGGMGILASFFMPWFVISLGILGSASISQAQFMNLAIKVGKGTSIDLNLLFTTTLSSGVISLISFIIFELLTKMGRSQLAKIVGGTLALSSFIVSFSSLIILFWMVRDMNQSENGGVSPGWGVLVAGISSLLMLMGTWKIFTK